MLSALAKKSVENLGLVNFFMLHVRKTKLPRVRQAVEFRQVRKIKSGSNLKSIALAHSNTQRADTKGAKLETAKR